MKMNTKERVFVHKLKLKGRKKEIRNPFQKKFHRKRTDKAIDELLIKFQRTGPVLDDRGSGHPVNLKKEGI